MKTAAMFDFDGTLYTGHVWHDLVQHHQRAGRQRFWVMAYMLRNFALMPLYKMGLMSQEAFYEEWATTMPWLMRGWRVREARDLFEALTRMRIMPNLRPDMMARLRWHQEQGHLVALVSGTFAPWLEAVARQMEVPHAIGTLLEVRDGHYSGRLVPPLCQGAGKPERVRMYLAERGLAIDWAASTAYADRASDLPLLREVGHPVAVYPDEPLRAVAEQHGWPVLGEVGG
jgi:HAD superfamily hydrolase (TIGR01490 family)